MLRPKENKTKEVLAIAFFFFWVCVNAQQNKEVKEFEPYTNNAEIEITVKGCPAVMVRLYNVYGNQNLIQDSAMCDSAGKVVFKNKGRYKSALYYAVYQDNAVISFLMDRNQKFYLHADKIDVMNSMETNSAENRLFYSNQIYEVDLQRRHEKVNAAIAAAAIGSKEYLEHKAEKAKLMEEKAQKVKSYTDDYPGSFFAKFKKMGQNPALTEPKKPNGDLDTATQVVTYRNHFWDNFDWNDERLLRTPVYFNKLKTYLNDLFPQRVDSVMIGAKFVLDKVDKGNKEIFSFTVNYLGITYRESTIMGGEKIFCYTIDNYFTYQRAFWSDSANIVRTRALSDKMRPSLLGSIGQDLNCKNEQGIYVSLYSIKKPIRIVYLYNPDCEHCQKETPKLKVLYDKWKTKGLEVYALDVEHEYDKWHDYIKKINMDWVNVIDTTYESLYYKKYYIANTPGIYVLDAKNKIVAKQLHVDQLEPIFEKMILENKQ